MAHRAVAGADGWVMVRWPWFLVVALWGTAVGADEPYAPPTVDAVDQRVKEARGQPIAERLVTVSEGFVGAPYVLSPLGEGTGPDPDPRVRWDAFDCTTFVETSLALSASGSAEEAKKVLDNIRYRRGEPSFEGRRHFPEAEWLPELMGLGYLEDITPRVAGAEVQRVHKVLNQKTWKKRKKQILNQLPEERIPNGTYKIWVWPIDAARDGYRRIPPGTVLSVVRDDYRSIPVRVSHQGLVIKKGKRLYMRHAADRVYHRVVDERLDHFLSRIQKYKKWPVTGIHLAKVTDRRAPASTVSGGAANGPDRIQ